MKNPAKDSGGGSRDSLFANDIAMDDFVFDERVAAVFSDMINRSVPGYTTIVSMIGILAERYCQPGSRVYDLGCSLGASALSMQHHIGRDDYRLIAIDSSPAMINSLSSRVDESTAPPQMELRCDNILDAEIEDASVVVLNFTLQFIQPEHRPALMRRIYQGLRPGGILILSEKIRFPEPMLNDLFIEMYHRFKQAQGYSDLEISQKRSALENVLIPESIDSHKARLQDAGFNACDVWFQCFNFASMVAFRGRGSE